MKSRNKIKTQGELKALVSRLKKIRKKVVFTNGCFDILHAGHINYLEAAKEKGNILIIGINSDRSVKKIKGTLRPIMPGADRAVVLAALNCVDYVVFFNESTPLKLIQKLNPDILIKGADWKKNSIVGSAAVKSKGGRVLTVPLLKNRSTSKTINIILKRYGKKR